MATKRETLLSIAKMIRTGIPCSRIMTSLHRVGRTDISLADIAAVCDIFDGRLHDRKIPTDSTFCPSMTWKCKYENNNGHMPMHRHMVG